MNTGFKTSKAIRLPGSDGAISDLGAQVKVVWSTDFADIDPSYRAVLFKQLVNEIVREATVQFNRAFAAPEPRIRRVSE